MTFAGVALPDLIAPPEVHPGRVRLTQTAGGHTGAMVPRHVAHPPFMRLTAPIAWSTVALTIHADGSSRAELAGASCFPRHYLYDTDGNLTHKSALISYRHWLRRAEHEDSPWSGAAHPVPVAHVRGAAERALADTILVSGGYRQQRLPAGARLSEAPIADTEVHVLLDGLLVIEFDGKPAVEVGPGAIFDPAKRTQVSKEHAIVRAKTACRLAVLPRDHLDSAALLGVATEQISRLQAYAAKAAQH
jgi:CRP-like cAMP-binding protein